MTAAGGADEPRLAAWERWLDWPLTGLAVAFLVAYAWSVLDVDLAGRARSWLDAALWLVWAVFAADYLLRLGLARRRWRFARRHLLGLVVIVLPMFRQLRVRLITVLSVLNRQVRGDFRGRVAVYVAGATVLVSFTAALAVLDAERQHPDGSITTFSDALWWTITTISTVGYGDRYPVTAQGRLVAASLMVAGIALLGVVTASIAAWFVEKIRVVEESVEEVEVAVEQAAEVAAAAERTTQADLAEVLAELRRLSDRLEALTDVDRQRR